MAVKTNAQIALAVSRRSILVNIMLSALMFFAGIFSHSAALVSNAAHAASDVLSTIIVMIGVKSASRASDKEHPFGHERFECVAAIILAVIVFATGCGIGFDSILRLLSGDETLSVPGTLALAAALISVAAKEGMYWYTRKSARNINSGALMADAWHNRADALSSVGSFAGILGARLGFPVMDTVACLLICVLILRAAVSIFRDAVGKMTDRACNDETAAQIRSVILAQNDVLSIDRLRTRLFGDRIYVEVEIGVDRNAPLLETHEIAHQVHDAIESGFPKVKHCMVHVNPSAPPEDSASHPG